MSASNQIADTAGAVRAASVAAMVGSPNAAATPATPPARPDPQALDQAVQKLNAAMAERSSNITFSIDEDSGKTLVKVIDSQSKDVLMQIPSQEALAIDKQIDRFQGLLVKTRA
jgi:flagellar protein FlaG